VGPNAVELTADQAWFIADTVGAGSFPWVLAITPPYREPAARETFGADRIAELSRMRVIDACDTINPAVAQWIEVVCRPQRWLELRFVSGGVDVLRGIVARRSGRTGQQTVVALRSAQLITFSEVDILHPQAIVPVVTAGLSGRRPARFDEFSIPARVGARADEQLRAGVALTDTLEFLGVPCSARPLVSDVFDGGRSYVEIVAGEYRDAHRVLTEVGVAVVDTRRGRILVSPTKGFDGEWISSFSPGDPESIATAVMQLTAALPGGGWFSAPLPHACEEHDYEERAQHPCRTTL